MASWLSEFYVTRRIVSVRQMAQPRERHFSSRQLPRRMAAGGLLPAHILHFLYRVRICAWATSEQTRPRFRPPNEEALVLSPTKTDRSGNFLLDRLPKEEQHRLLRSGEAVSLPHGFEIYRQGRPISHV